jgi:hypothetical protein
MKSYRPLNSISKVEMRLQLSKIKMRKGMDPCILFTTLTSIQNQYLGPGKHLLQDKLISIILSVATEEYWHALSIEQKIRGDSLTVEHLESVMTEEYRQNNGNQIKQISNNKGELLLFQNMTGR